MTKIKFFFEYAKWKKEIREKISCKHSIESTGKCKMSGLFCETLWGFWYIGASAKSPLYQSICLLRFFVEWRARCEQRAHTLKEVTGDAMNKLLHNTDFFRHWMMWLKLEMFFKQSNRGALVDELREAASMDIGKKKTSNRTDEKQKCGKQGVF